MPWQITLVLLSTRMAMRAPAGLFGPRACEPDFRLDQVSAGCWYPLVAGATCERRRAWRLLRDKFSDKSPVLRAYFFGGVFSVPVMPRPPVPVAEEAVTSPLSQAAVN